MATLKRIEKRMNEVESWVADFNKSNGPKQTMDNLNWLVGQTRAIGERMGRADAEINDMKSALESNSQIVNAFLEKHDMVMDWQGFLAELEQEAKDNAEKSAAEVPAPTLEPEE
jgi:tetrahydromethanopterin S-methyltransferase subunit B|tara:strand:+ start:1524 stop:1865 length:342 start_codon:yes stop_codon:yes gene_type:complete